MIKYLTSDPLNYYIYLMASSSFTKTKISTRYSSHLALSTSETSLELLCNFWREMGSSPIDDQGDTILHFLAIYGNTGGLQVLIREGLLKNEDLMRKNRKGDTPLHEAARFGQRGVAEIMVSSVEKDLVHVCNNLGETPLYVAAACGEVEVFKLLEEFQSDCRMTRNDGQTILHAAVFGEFHCCSWLKRIDDAKQKHTLALALAKTLIEDDEKGVSKPLIEATKHGIIELATEVLNAWPDAALNSYDENGRNIFHVAVEHKRKFVYEKLKKIVLHKQRMMAEVDYHGNTILHLAANSEPIPDFPIAVLALFRMMWDISWFQRVKYDVDPRLQRLCNDDGKTAEQLLEENHFELRNTAETATKAAVQGPMVASALIATVNFAAMFTLPGGFDQNHGQPLLYGTYLRHDLRFLMGYIWANLVCSLMCLGAQLTLQIAPYHINHFLFDLPGEILIASTTLFYSVSYTVITVLQAYILEDSITSEYIATMLIVLLLLPANFYLNATLPIYIHLIEAIFHI